MFANTNLALSLLLHFFSIGSLLQIFFSIPQRWGKVYKIGSLHGNKGKPG